VALFSAYNGENLAYNIREMGNIRSDPYTRQDFEDAMPSPTSIAMLPLKLSLYASTIRSAWYGMGYIGSTANRFNPNRLKWRYRATTVDGLIGGTIRAIQNGTVRLFRGEAFTFGKWKTMKNSVKSMRDAFVQHGLSPLTAGKYPGTMVGITKATRSFRPKEGFKEVRRLFMEHTGRSGPAIESGQRTKPWSRIYTPQGETAFMAARGTWSMGLMDRFYLSPKNISSNLESLLEKGVFAAGDDAQGIYKALSTDNAFAQNLARELYAGDLRSVAHQRGKADIIERSVWGKTRADAMSRKQYRQYYRDVLKDRKTTTLWDIIKGESRTKGTFWDRRKGFFVGENRVRFTRNMTGARPFMGTRFTFWWNRAAYGKLYGQVAEAAMRTMRDQGVQNVASAAVREAAGNIASTVVGRVRLAKLVRGVGIAAYAIPMALQGAMSAYKTATEVVARAAPTMRMLTRMEFGTGEVLDSARMATERQRAVSAIQNAHMNARYLLGNEASLYH